MTVITWVAVAAVAFILFVVFLLLGIVRKKVWMIIVSVLCVGVGMLAGSAAFIRASTVAIHAVTEVAADRTAEEVYASEFGRGENCAQVIDYYDPSVTVINDRRYVCISCCTEEARRILSQRRYDVAERRTADIVNNMNQKCCRTFFTVERFGPTVKECLASEGKDAFTLYVSADSTRIYYIREIK
jgi:hypothetical protein